MTDMESIIFVFVMIILLGLADIYRTFSKQEKRIRELEDRLKK